MTRTKEVSKWVCSNLAKGTLILLKGNRKLSVFCCFDRVGKQGRKNSFSRFYSLVTTLFFDMDHYVFVNLLISKLSFNDRSKFSFVCLVLFLIAVAVKIILNEQ